MIFADVNDSARFLQAGVIHGNLLGRQQRYAEAETFFRDLLQVAVSSGDIETQARLHNNLGHCAVSLGDYADANIHFSESIAKFTDLGLRRGGPAYPIAALRRFLSEGVNSTLGLRRLEDARRSFAALQMSGEAGPLRVRSSKSLIERGDIVQALALLQIQ